MLLAILIITSALLAIEILGFLGIKNPKLRREAYRNIAHEIVVTSDLPGMIVNEMNRQQRTRRSRA